LTELTFQLFSARNTALPEALAIVSGAGYKCVEAYGENFTDADAFETLLAKHSLKVVSVHVGLDKLKYELDASIAQAKRFGITHIVCPFLLPEDRPESAAAWIELAEQLAAIEASLKQEDLSFAWHNHDFEMIPMANGSVPMTLLMENAPQLNWELDIGWIHRTGSDSLSWLNRYADRISALHLKDVAQTGTNEDEDGWADVGSGVIDWESLLPGIKACNTNLLIVEHDNPNNLERFAKNTHTAVQGWAW